MGTIEGNIAKLRSVDRLPGDSISLFSQVRLQGKPSRDLFAMVNTELQKFVAKRNNNKLPREKIVVPGGPPLAT